MAQERGAETGSVNLQNTVSVQGGLAILNLCTGTCREVVKIEECRLLGCDTM
jgi:hypothetical protein